MTETPRDNLMHRKFVPDLQAVRTTSRCAWRSNLSDSPLLTGRYVCIIEQMTTHNRCDCFGGHDRTGQDPGDKLLAGR